MFFSLYPSVVCKNPWGEINHTSWQVVLVALKTTVVVINSKQNIVTN